MILLEIIYSFHYACKELLHFNWFNAICKLYSDHITFKSSTMKGLFSKPIPLKIVSTILLIGDQGSNKSVFYHALEIEQQQPAQQVTLYIKKLAQNSFLQLFDFPVDKLVRPALQIYFSIFQKPSLILYFVKDDAKSTDTAQWIAILKEYHLQSRIIFVSDVSTYLQRQKIITRIGLEFEANILENISFICLEPHSIHRLLNNPLNVGMRVASAVCLRPCFTQRFKEHWNDIIFKSKKIMRRLLTKQYSSSVI